MGSLPPEIPFPRGRDRVVKPKCAVLSYWVNALPFHATQMGEAMDADFIFTPAMDDEGLIKCAEEHDLLFLCTEMLSKPADVIRFVKMLTELKGRGNKTAKIVFMEVELFTYYELAFLGIDFVRDNIKNAELEMFEPRIPEWWFKLLRLTDLNIAMSDHASQVIKLAAPDVPVEVLAFIPEPDWVYEEVQAATKRKDKDTLFVGIGSKIGPGRLGGLDTLVAAELKRRLNRKVAIVPLTAGGSAEYYKMLADSLGLRCVEPMGLSYLEYLSALCGLDLVIHLDPLQSVGRLSFESAMMGVPCIGTQHIYYQGKLFPKLSMKSLDPFEAVELAMMAMGEGREKILDDAKKLARNNNRECQTERREMMLKDICVDFEE